MDMQQIGGYAFIIGVLLAIIAPFLLAGAAWVPLTLIILGLIVGLLNVTDKETVSFLVATIALGMTKTAFSGLSADWAWITTIVTNIAVFVAPAGLIVALVAVLKMAKTA